MKFLEGKGLRTYTNMKLILNKGLIESFFSRKRANVSYAVVFNYRLTWLII